MRFRLPFSMAFVAVIAFAARAADFNAANYGAEGDAATVNTAAIQKAIDAAAPAHGTVVFKPGVFITGALFVS